MAASEALLTGRVRLGAATEQRLDGRAFIVRDQPDLEVDGDGEYVLDGDGRYIILGIWDTGQLQGFVDIDLSILEAALPRLGVRQQIGGLEVWVAEEPGVTPFHRLDVLPDITVELALGQPARFSFALPLKKRNPLNLFSVERPLPPPMTTMGAPTGLRAITIQGAYLTDSGQVRVPLITRGLAGGEATVVAQGDGSVLSISGGDRWSALERRIEAGFSIPPGSGLPRGVVFQMLAEHGHWGPSAGVSTVSGWGGTPMHHTFAVVNTEVMSALAEIADADNRLLYVDNNVLTALPEVDTTSPIAFVLGPRDLIKAETVQVDGPGRNPPTQVFISGTEQVLREQTGLRTLPPRVAKAWSRYAPKRALATQDSAGNVTPNGATQEAPDLELVSQTTTLLTYDSDTLVKEETTFEGWYNPETWRYRFVTDPDGVDGGGDFDAYHSGAYLYDAGATKNDATPSYAWPRERFNVIARQISTHTYDGRNFHVRSEQIKHGWLTLQQAIKTRASKAVSFEATNHSAVNILAGGIAAKGHLSANDGERFVGPAQAIGAPSFGSLNPDVTERITVEHAVNDLGYITSTTTTREAWDALVGSGSKYLYGDGTTRNTEEYEFIEVEKVIEQYYAEGASARKATTRTGIGGDILEVIDEPMEGYFPIAEQRVDISPDPALYVGREDLLAQARAASRSEGKAIHVDMTSGALESQYLRSTLAEEFTLGENAADLERRARARLQLHSALPVSLTVLGNWLIKPGIRVHVQDPRIDLDDDVHVVAVTHTQSGQSLLTQIQGRIYVT